jgi:hypothetical protein
MKPSVRYILDDEDREVLGHAFAYGCLLNLAPTHLHDFMPREPDARWHEVMVQMFTGRESSTPMGRQIRECGLSRRQVSDLRQGILDIADAWENLQESAPGMEAILARQKEFVALACKKAVLACGATTKSENLLYNREGRSF